MQIGNIEEFQQGQMSKVERCKKEAERIKKGVYRMHVMIEEQCAETLDKEREKQQKQTKAADGEENSSESKQNKSVKPDLDTELEKLKSFTSRNARLVGRISL